MKKHLVVAIFLASCSNGGGDKADAVAVADAGNELSLQCPTDCDDGNQCTEDSCDIGSGECVNAPLAVGTSCDDASACTRDDACDGGGGCSGADISCDDLLACTEDSCDPAVGCVNTGPAPDELCTEPLPVTAVNVRPYLQDAQTNRMTVMWETVESCPGDVFFGPDPYYGREALEETEGTIHEITLDGLEPGTDYYYRVAPCRGDLLLPEVYHFRTPPAGPEPFMFAVWGDSRTQPWVASEVTAGIAASEPALVVNVGDVVTSGEVYEQWKLEYFDPLAAFSGNVPSYIAIGNHEDDADWFYAYVSQPAPENYMALTYGDARLVLLDTNHDYTEGSEQHDWLMAELSSPEYTGAEWHFVFFHHPPYSEQWDSEGYVGDWLVATFLLPDIAEADVDVLFCGHTHDYERGFIPMGKGMHYVITGGGGAALDMVHNKDWEEIDVYASEYHFMTVDIDGKDAVVTARFPDGSVLDEFEIHH